MAELAGETTGTEAPGSTIGSGAIGSGTIRNALTLARKHGFDEVELRSGEGRFTATLLGRKPAARKGAPAQAEPAAPVATEVKSHNVGFVHLADLAPGAAVKEGALLATVETLGIANDLLAPRAGVLKEFRVEDESPVEFGQIVAVLEAVS